MTADGSWEVRCPQCGAATVRAVAGLVELLRAAGMLKREAKPARELVVELVRSQQAKFACRDCAHLGLQMREIDEGNDEEWGFSRRCDACGQPIPAERLEIFPGSRLCVACQGKDERGEAQAAPEFCRHCGGLLQLRLSRRGGLARYELACGNCRGK